MKSDYKFQSISTDGKTTKCRVAFYEGDVTTESEELSGVVRNVTRYRRTRLLRTQSFEFSDTLPDIQLRIELNKELSKDTTRIPIDIQKNVQIL